MRAPSVWAGMRGGRKAVKPAPGGGGTDQEQGFQTTTEHEFNNRLTESLVNSSLCSPFVPLPLRLPLRLRLRPSDTRHRLRPVLRSPGSRGREGVIQWRLKPNHGIRRGTSSLTPWDLGSGNSGRLCCLVTDSGPCRLCRVLASCLLSLEGLEAQRNPNRLARLPLPLVFFSLDVLQRLFFSLHRKETRRRGARSEAYLTCGRLSEGSDHL